MYKFILLHVIKEVTKSAVSKFFIMMLPILNLYFVIWYRTNISKFFVTTQSIKEVNFAMKDKHCSRAFATEPVDREVVPVIKNLIKQD